MKTSFGHVKVKVTHYDRLVYGYARKKYTRTKPPVKGWLKIKPNPRENCAIIKLRRFGYSINQLSDVLGRSRSYIHRILRTAINRGITHFDDKRKMPSQIRLAQSVKRRFRLEKWLTLWMPFIFNESEKPP